MIGKKQIAKFLLYFSTMLFLNSCTTAAYSTYDYDYSILDIQKAVVENLPQGLGATNSNRRVFYSKRFTVKHTRKGRIPLVMRIIIEGDRRPYGLVVDVKKVSPSIANLEEAFSYGEDFKGQVSLAKRVVKNIEEQLAQRRKSKNLFDDFRPF